MDWKPHRRRAHALGRTQEHLKQLVYGGNDGIVTTFAIVAGFAGAAADGVAQVGGLAVLVFGLANLFADAVSMGLGEYLSLRSQHVLYRSRRKSELEQIANRPDHQRMELVEILRQRGIPTDDADTAAAILSRHPDVMADLMMSQNVGMSNPERENPLVSGLSTFLSFVVFGSIPLTPYFLLPPDDRTFLLSVLATVLALVSLGLLRWNATGERLIRSVGETVLIGAICAVVAFAVGWIVAG